MPNLTTANGEPLPYADAVIELEDILRSLESSNVDVDSLATQVERATALIGYCRGRLATVEGNVAAVLDGTRSPDTQPPDTQPPGAKASEVTDD